MCIIQYAEFFSWHCLCLIHAEAQLGHAGLEHLAHAVVLHDLHQHGEGLLLGHLHEQQAHDEGGPLAVAHLPVVVQYHPVTFSNLGHVKPECNFLSPVKKKLIFWHESASQWLCLGCSTKATKDSTNILLQLDSALSQLKLKLKNHGRIF